MSDKAVLFWGYVVVNTNSAVFSFLFAVNNTNITPNKSDTTPKISAQPLKTYMVAVFFLARAAKLCSDTGAWSSKPIICTLPPVAS